MKKIEATYNDKRKGLSYKPYMVSPVLRQEEVRNDRNVDGGCASTATIMTNDGYNCGCSVEGFLVEDFDFMECEFKTTEII